MVEFQYLIFVTYLLVSIFLIVSFDHEDYFYVFCGLILVMWKDVCIYIHAVPEYKYIYFSKWKVVESVGTW